MEKRSQTRFYDRGSVVCSHFNHGHHCDAQMLNFSRKGMCIRSDHFFKPGTAVLVRIDDCPKGEAVRHEKGGMRTVTLAKVLWSRHDEKTHEQRFTSGLRYF